MAKAHITIGMAAAFTSTTPTTVPEALPEEGIEIYSRCLVCRINDRKLESLKPEDFQPGFMKYLAR